MMCEQEYNIDCFVRKGFAKRIRRTQVSPERINNSVVELLVDENAKEAAKEYARHIEKWLNLRHQKIRQFFQALSAGTLA